MATALLRSKAPAEEIELKSLSEQQAGGSPNLLERRTTTVHSVHRHVAILSFSPPSSSIALSRRVIQPLADTVYFLRPPWTLMTQEAKINQDTAMRSDSPSQLPNPLSLRPKPSN